MSSIQCRWYICSDLYSRTNYFSTLHRHPGKLITSSAAEFAYHSQLSSESGIQHASGKSCAFAKNKNCFEALTFITIGIKKEQKNLISKLYHVGSQNSEQNKDASLELFNSEAPWGETFLFRCIRVETVNDCWISAVEIQPSLISGTSTIKIHH